MFSDLASEQRRRGWEVAALTSNRSCFNPERVYPAREDWDGIAIHRVFRPPLRQSRPIQRLANSGWMTAAWVAAARRLGPFDAVVVGSDPAFAPLVGPGFRRLWPKAALAHWCFDVYPEAIAAEGGGAATRALVPVAARLMGWAYRSYDALVDIGPRMGERLAAYRSGARQLTLTPWALAEGDGPPADPAVRHELFGAGQAGATLFRDHGARPRSPRAAGGGARLPAALGERHHLLLRLARKPARRAAGGGVGRRHQRPLRGVRRRGRAGRPPAGGRPEPHQLATRVGRRRGAVQVLRGAGGRPAGPLRGPRRLRDCALDRPARRRPGRGPGRHRRGGGGAPGCTTWRAPGPRWRPGRPTPERSTSATSRRP